MDKNLAEIANQISNVVVLPDLEQYIKLSSSVDHLGNQLVINIHESPLHGIPVVLKRIADILGSILAILLFSPVMALITVLVKFSSAGPIFYKQRRMGIDGNLFNIYKFRTMVQGAEKKSGAVWARADDTRKTVLGNFLRKTSLDELPQFFNVLRGDMSLVGPRPERPVFVDQFRRSVPGYMLRHKVKAGITGWAQINGWRGNTSIDKRIEYDLYYIRNWSMWLDVKILIKTVFKGFINPNAY